jgi:hypothetical protein
MFVRSLQIVATVAALVGFAPALQDSLAGTWVIQVPDVVRNEDGKQTVESTTTATFKLEIRGDSVFGTVTRGTSPTSRQVRGTVRGNQVILMASTRAQVNSNGSEHMLSIITTYKFTRNGDKMSGTSETAIDKTAGQQVTIPGVEQEPIAISGTRVKP